MALIDKLVNILKEKHGKELNLTDEVHYLFFEDGVFNIYLEDDDDGKKTLKVDVQLLPKGDTYVYHSDESMNKLMEEGL